MWRGCSSAGIPVALGNDGFSNNMFEEMKAAYLAHKHNSGDPQAMPGDVVMADGLRQQRALLPAVLPEAARRAERRRVRRHRLPGLRPATPLTTGNLPWHILFGVDGAHVTHTIAGGKVLMKDRQLTTLDEAAIMAKARELAVGVWKRVGR